MNAIKRVDGNKYKIKDLLAAAPGLFTICFDEKNPLSSTYKVEECGHEPGDLDKKVELKVEWWPAGNGEPNEAFHLTFKADEHIASCSFYNEKKFEAFVDALTK